MDKNYTVTRKQILETARRYIGLPFVHQGRSKETGVDCVGLLVCILQELEYPYLTDAEAYRRIPSATLIRAKLLENFDEIAIADAREGDVFHMRLGGIKPRHTSILCFDDAYGDEPCIIHATKDGVHLDPKNRFPDHWYVTAFRFRGVID